MSFALVYILTIIYSGISVVMRANHYLLGTAQSLNTTIMINRIFILHIHFILCVSSVTSFGQFCTSNDRFTEVEYFFDNQIDSLIDLTYGQAINWLGDSMDLKLNVYFPSIGQDPLPRRPFILLIHGGAFQGGIKESWNYDCREFAKRGYVAATMEYRRGWSEQIPVSFGHAIYRAQQDAQAALRAVVQHRHVIKIDTSWMFIGGASSGAMTALNTVYLDQDEWESRIPGIESLLGSLHNSGNRLPDNYTLKGVYNAWGATEESAIDISEMVPTVSFHGLLDNVVQIGDWGNGIVGSAIIHDMLISNGFCSELTVDSLGGHTIFGSNTKTGDTYRAGRVSCFIKSVFCDDCTSIYLTDSITADCSVPAATLPSLSQANVSDDFVLKEIAAIPTVTSTPSGFIVQFEESIPFYGNIYSVNGQLLNRVQGQTNIEIPINLYYSPVLFITYSINNQSHTGRIVLHR